MDALDNAVAHVGCPDGRIDRLCITCRSPSQPSLTPDARCDLVKSWRNCKEEATVTFPGSGEGGHTPIRHF
jgi:hypothetical protein